jgi:hypothetical protein
MVSEPVGLVKRKRTIDTMKLFAVIRSRGDAWNPSLGWRSNPTGELTPPS